MTPAGRRIAGGILALGLALRLLMMLAHRPAFTGYPDSSVYLSGAIGEALADPLRPGGYPLFLKVAHALSDSLSLTTLLQHGLGVATGVLLYLTVLRLGAPRWTALVAGGVVLLGGDQLFFEHAILSEALFGALLAAALYAVVRAGDHWGWAAAAGVLVGLAATVRLAALALAIVLVAWVAGARARLACAAGAAIVVLAYLVAVHDETGEWSLARNGAYNFYGRVAGFADCREFDPPAGTRALCERTPEDDRPSPQWYIFDPRSPAVRRFGEPQTGGASRTDVDRVAAFARAAAAAQPLGLARAAASDFARYVAPGSFRPPVPPPSIADYQRTLLDRHWTERAQQLVARHWSTAGTHTSPGLLDRLRDYERITRVEGPAMGVLLVLALLGAVLAAGPLRRGAVLLGATALALLAVPVITHEYDGRFGVPAYGPLAGAAALGALALATRLRRYSPGSESDAATAQGVGVRPDGGDRPQHLDR